MFRTLPLILALLLLAGPSAARAGTRHVPRGKALAECVATYLEASYGERASMRARWDAELAPLDARTLRSLRAELLKLALARGPTLKKGTHYLLDEEGKKGKYILSGKPGKALFLGLHGGGQGAGDAGSAAGAMGGGGWMWIYPEVLEKTARGWTSPGTEEFVIALVQAAKRTWKNLDPDRIYLSGHSMGGYGTWTIGAHHADMFAGLAAYAGAPTPVGTPTGAIVQPGIIPNLYNMPLHFYQSGDDRNVPPEANDLAHRVLQTWRADHPQGFEFRYERVEGRGHAPPKEGYLPSQRWLAEHTRRPRPPKFLWQPVLGWKRQFYWAWWAHAEHEAVLQFEAKGRSRIEVTSLEGSGDVSGLSVLLGEPVVDPTREVVIVVNGEERYRGVPARTFSTLMLTLPCLDERLLFDARVDL